MTTKEYEPVETVVLSISDWYLVLDAINKHSQDYMAREYPERSETLDCVYQLIREQLEE